MCNKTDLIKAHYETILNIPNQKAKVTEKSTSAAIKGRIYLQISFRQQLTHVDLWLPSG